MKDINLEEYNRFSIPPAVYVQIGNPHLVCFVEKLDHGKKLGSTLEKQLGLVNPEFPENVNVGFAKIVDTNTIALSVFERGVGFTPACGTGACAAAIAAFSHNLVESQVTVIQEGGPLSITLKEGKSLSMTGDATLLFKGTIPIGQENLRTTHGEYTFYGATITEAIMKKQDVEKTFHIRADFGPHGLRTTEVCLSCHYTEETLKGLGIIGTLGKEQTFTILGSQDETGAITLHKKPEDLGNGELCDD
jgi:hypothetical protein